MIDMNENVQVLLDTGAAMARPVNVTNGDGLEAIPYSVIPANWKLESLERLFPCPPRKKATAHLRDVPSLERYLTQHGTEDTALFVGVEGNVIQFKACLDYHSPKPDGPARWRDHVALYAPPISPRLRVWQEWDAEWHTQEQMAEFLEDNKEDVMEPSGAALVEIAMAMQAKKDHDFRSAVNLENGAVQFHFVETVTVKGGAAGELVVPKKFKVALPLYEGFAPRQVFEARLRYRIGDEDEGRKLSFRFDLLKFAETVQRGQEELTAAVAKATKLVPFMGNYN